MKLWENKPCGKTKSSKKFTSTPEEYARSFNYDLDAIFADLRKKQNAHPEKVVRLPIKRRPNHNSWEQTKPQ